MLTVFSSPSSLRSDLVKLAARPLTLRLSKGMTATLTFFLGSTQILMLAAAEAPWQTRQALPMEEQVEERATFLLTQTGSASIPINASFELFVEASGVNRCIISGFSMRFPSKMHRQTNCSLKLLKQSRSGTIMSPSPTQIITQSTPMTLSLNPSLTPEQILIDWDAKYESDEGSNVFPVKAFHDGLGGSLSAGTFYSRKTRNLIS